MRIRARGVQYVDVLMLAGKYQFRPDPPFIPGNEGAGEVVAVGPDVTGFKLGDPVMSRQRLGAFAELGNAAAEHCDPVPAGLSLDEAAVFRGAYTTAYHALLQRGRLKAGDWVLIHGAAGGIGLPAIQIAKLYGAKSSPPPAPTKNARSAWPRAPISPSPIRVGSATRSWN